MRKVLRQLSYGALIIYSILTVVFYGDADNTIWIKVGGVVFSSIVFLHSLFHGFKQISLSLCALITFMIAASLSALYHNDNLFISLFLGIILVLAASQFYCKSRLMFGLGWGTTIGSSLLILERVIYNGGYFNGFGLIRWEGGAGNPNDYSLFLSLACLWLFWLFHQRKFRNHLSGLFILFFGLLIFIELVVFAGSRAALVGVIVCYFTTARFWHSAALVALTSLAIGLLSPSINADDFRMSTRFTDLNSDYSLGVRSELAAKAALKWMEKPMFGSGTNTFRQVNDGGSGFHSHVNYLELLSNNGILGFFLYYSGLFYVLYQALTKRHVSPEERMTHLLVILILFFDFAAVTYYNKVVLLNMSLILRK